MSKVITISINYFKMYLNKIPITTLPKFDISIVGVLLLQLFTVGHLNDSILLYLTNFLFICQFFAIFRLRIKVHAKCFCQKLIWNFNLT